MSVWRGRSCLRRGANAESMRMSVSRMMSCSCTHENANAHATARTCGGPSFSPFTSTSTLVAVIPLRLTFEISSRAPTFKRRHRLLQHLRRHARVDQGAQKHVAAHAGKAIEVCNAHGKTVASRQSLVVGQAHAACSVVMRCSFSRWAERRRRFSRDSRPLGFANDQRLTTNDEFPS